MAERDLTLVGLTEDEQRLVLVSDSGQEFTLPADARLRAALRGDHARLGQLEINMDSSLRPRDIQSRIRAGESPEKVAAAAQTTVDKIMAFAVPVLAERAHVADLAQRASVRRSGQGPARALADAVAERLHTRSVAPDAVEWDAWRRDDGRWTLVADYRSGESVRHAEFVYDAPGRYVVAEDDEARWLVGEQPTSSHGPQPRTATGPRRLSAVDRTLDRDGDELPLGEDAIDLVSEDRARDGLEVSGGDADWFATQATERPSPGPAGSADEPAPTGDALDPLDPAALVELGSEADTEDQEEDTEGTGEDTEDTAAVDVSRAAPAPEAEQDPGDGAVPEEVVVSVDESDDGTPRKARRTKRASVPSWDEIMFGGGRD
jgi:hypothetical protein